MLYPIELLRHTSPARLAVRWTACMVTGRPAFVMSSVGFLSVGIRRTESRISPTVQNALLQKGGVAKRNAMFA